MINSTFITIYGLLSCNNDDDNLVVSPSLYSVLLSSWHAQTVAFALNAVLNSVANAKSKEIYSENGTTATIRIKLTSFSAEP